MTVVEFFCGNCGQIEEQFAVEEGTEWEVDSPDYNCLRCASRENKIRVVP